MAEKISFFEMTNFRALITLKISNIFKIRLFIRVTHCRNTRIQMDLSKNKHFSAKKARKKVPVCEMLEFSGSLSFPMLLILFWKLKIIAYRGSSMVPPSFKLKLFYQSKWLPLSQRAPSWMIWGLRPAFGMFVLCAKHYQQDLNITKSTFTCSKLKCRALKQDLKDNYAAKVTIKAPKQR